MKQYLQRTCPTCGLDIQFGLWAHAIQCAKDKEQREAAKRAIDNGKRLVNSLKRQRSASRGK